MADLELDDQVREVVDDMLANRWFSGPSHAEKAEKWGVSISVVWRRASEASRFIRLCCRASADDIRDESLRNVGRIGVKAELDGQYRDALTAQELFMRVHGFLDTKRRDDDSDEPVPVEQLAAALRKLGHEVKLNERPSDDSGAARASGSEAEGLGRIEGLLESEDEGE